MEHVIAVSTVANEGAFWDGLKQAHARLPKGVRWKIAVASKDGTKAVNIIVGDSLASVRDFFGECTGDSAVTEYFEADAANAVGLPR